MQKAFKYIFSMKRLPLFILLIAVGLFFAFQTNGNNSKLPPGKYESIMKLVNDLLKEGHFAPQKIDDAFSKKVFDSYMANLDPDKTIFYKEDHDLLEKKYGTRIDDELNGAPVAFCFEAGKIFKTRLEEAAKITTQVLAKPFDYNKQETVQLDGEKLNYVTGYAESMERWRKKLKYNSLVRYVDLQEIREKNKGTDSFKVYNDAELEKQAREKTEKEMNLYFNRFKYKFNDDDNFNMYVNTITSVMDPHTNFMPPVDKTYFDQEMSGTFYGIGASLIYEEGNIKVTSILSGTPAWRSGELQSGDIITKVAQGDEEPVELIGYTVTDAVKVIRGKLGSTVKLTVKKTDGSVKVVALKREKINQDQTFARSAIINTPQSKMGIIYLPEFYADFENASERRSYTDVANEIKKLKEENVEGIIMDLRNNGGGSLYDVIQMVGLFIESGPVVQVKEKGNNRTNVLNDRDPSVLYNGPLVVMVNEFSASASEIFAAAIQDYGRGVVIGSTSTFGKGTVQRNIGLDPVNGYSNTNADLGTVKLTMQKFYRVNGKSTQLKGVASDIVLPDQYEYYDIREKDEKNALGWDEIASSKYKTVAPQFDLETLKKESAERIAADTLFNLIKKNALWLKEQNNKTYNLNINSYKEEQKAIKAAVAKINDALKLRKENNIELLKTDTISFSGNDSKKDFYNLWLSSIKKDIYINQGAIIMNDIIKQQSLAKTNPAEPVEKEKRAF